MEVRIKNRRIGESLNALVLKNNIRVSPKLHCKDRRIKKKSHLDLVSLHNWSAWCYFFFFFSFLMAVQFQLSPVLL